MKLPQVSPFPAALLAVIGGGAAMFLTCLRAARAAACDGPSGSGMATQLIVGDAHCGVRIYQ